MPIALINQDTQEIEIGTLTYPGPGMTLEEAAEAMGWEEGTWREITPLEMKEIQKMFENQPTMEYKQGPDNQWYRWRYSKKDFMLWCGLDKMIACNAAISGGNHVVKTVLDLLQASEFISLEDPNTIQMLGILATPTGGDIFNQQDVDRILTGEPWVNPVE